MRDLLNASWKLLVIRGVIAVIVGIVVMTWPEETVVALTVIFGIWALVDGIALAVSGFGVNEPRGVRAFAIVMALIALGIAFFLIIHPTDTVKVLTWVAGVWLLVRGVHDLVVGVLNRGSNGPRWLYFLTGAVNLAIGILFVANPGKAAVGIAVLLGALAVVVGVMQIFNGFVLRRDVKLYDEQNVVI